MPLSPSLAALILAAGPGAPEVVASDMERLLTGTFTNEEQNYFERDAGRTPPPWLSLRIERSDDGLTLTTINAYGEAQAATQPLAVNRGTTRDQLRVGNCTRNFDRGDKGWTYAAIQNRMACQQNFQIIGIAEDSLTVRFANGVETRLNRARPVKCWAAARKKEDKADGSPDWLFVRQLSLHDQGGRVRVGGGDSGAEELILRMRAVHWPPPSTNRPSMVLYVHKPAEPNRAVSYSWADINASRVGLNLRWMQASCTIEGAERASEVNRDNFRG